MNANTFLTLFLTQKVTPNSNLSVDCREPTVSDRLTDLEQTAELDSQHLQQISWKQDHALQGTRRCLGGQRDLESAFIRRPTTSATEATWLPLNPVGRPLRVAAEFRELNARPADSHVRRQLVAADRVH
ncbi:hypothetical protein AAHC03_01626 [Spirometra sp. Aus1]